MNAKLKFVSCILALDVLICLSAIGEEKDIVCENKIILDEQYMQVRHIKLTGTDEDIGKVLYKSFV